MADLKGPGLTKGMCSVLAGIVGCWRTALSCLVSKSREDWVIQGAYLSYLRQPGNPQLQARELRDEPLSCKVQDASPIQPFELERGLTSASLPLPTSSQAGSFNV